MFHPRNLSAYLSSAFCLPDFLVVSSMSSRRCTRSLPKDHTRRERIPSETVGTVDALPGTFPSSEEARLGGGTIQCGFDTPE